MVQGPIVQIVALVLYGNHFLRGDQLSGFYPDNSSFQFCRSVTFVRLKATGGKPLELAYASAPGDWFAKLRNDGVVGLRVVHLPANDPGISERMSVAFVGGGGRWLIEAVHGSRSDYWEGRWETTGKQEPDRRIWVVTYGQVTEGERPSSTASKGMRQITQELESLLPRMQTFAERHNLPAFTAFFGDARKLLAAPSPLGAVYHKDIAPQGTLSPEAQALLAAAQTAWVFGGMGSWNDISFEGADQTDYDSLSEQLYVLLKQATIEATNSSFTGPSQEKPWWKLW
jgi:hypothetical protein